MSCYFVGMMSEIPKHAGPTDKFGKNQFDLSGIKYWVCCIKEPYLILKNRRTDNRFTIQWLSVKNRTDNRFTIQWLSVKNRTDNRFTRQWLSVKNRTDNRFTMTNVLIIVSTHWLTGADPGFQVRGGALKKIASSGGRRENFWGISCEKSRFYAKKSYFFQF